MVVYSFGELIKIQLKDAVIKSKVSKQMLLHFIKCHDPSKHFVNYYNDVLKVPRSEKAYTESIYEYYMDLDEYLSAALFSSGKYDIQSVDLISALVVLECIALHKPEYAPIFIVREPQQLEMDVKGDEYVDSVQCYLETRNQGQHLVPVIVETSDIRWLKRDHVLRSRESFGTFEVKSPTEQLLREVIPMHSIIDQEAFEYFLEHFGTHPGTWHLAEQMYRSNVDKESIVYQISKGFCNDLRGMVNSDMSRKRERIEFLLKLKKGGYSLLVGEWYDEIGFFLKKNVLIFDGKYVSVQHNMWKIAIEHYLFRNNQ